MKFKNTHFINKFIFLGIFLFGIFQGVTTAIGVYKNYSPVPFWDLWPAYVFFNTEIFKNPVKIFFTQHVDHFILVQNIISLIDWNFFGARLLFCYFVTYASSIVLMAIIFFMSTDGVNKRNKIDAKLMKIGVLSLMLTSWTQYENYTWAFQAQMFTVILFAALSFLTIYKFKITKRKYYLFISIISAIFSMGSMGNGILVFPILICYAFLLKLERKYLILIIINSITFFLLFILNFRASEQSIPFHIDIKSIVDIFFGVFLLIGGPIKIIYGGANEIIILSIGLIILFININNIYKCRKNQYPLIPLALFLILTSLIVVIGRSKSNPNFWYTSRYMSTVLTLWAVTFILEIQANKIKPFNLKIIFIILLSFLLLPFQLRALDSSEAIKNNKILAMVALNLEIKDQNQLNYIFPWPDILLVLSNSARYDNKSIFHEQIINGEFKFPDSNPEPINIFGINERAIDKSNYSKITFVYECKKIVNEPSKIIFINNNKYVGQGIATNFLDLKNTCLVDGYVIKDKLRLFILNNKIYDVIR